VCRCSNTIQAFSFFSREVQKLAFYTHYGVSHSPEKLAVRAAHTRTPNRPQPPLYVLLYKKTLTAHQLTAKQHTLLSPNPQNKIH
jgi:hypothetical protein